MDELFNLAANHLQTIISAISDDKKEDELLYLYARYKQATVGPCIASKPSFFNLAARKKWSCWNNLHDMKKEQAMTEYVDKIRSLDPSWDPQASKVRTGMGVAVSVMNNQENILSENEKNIFDYCKEGSLKKVIELLVGFPKDEEDRTLLHWACDRGHLNIVEYLVNEGHDINCKDSESSTPLHYASSCDHVEIVSFLLQHNADASIKDSDGEFPIDCAGSQRTKLIFERLQID